MDEKKYLSQVVGDGTENSPYRPALADHIGTYGADTTYSADVWLCTCSPTTAQEAAIAADIRIVEVSNG